MKSSNKLNRLKLGFATCSKLKITDEIINAKYLLKDVIRLLRMYPRRRTSSDIATNIKIPMLSNKSVRLNLMVRNSSCFDRIKQVNPDSIIINPRISPINISLAINIFSNPRLAKVFLSTNFLNNHTVIKVLTKVENVTMNDSFGVL